MLTSLHVWKNSWSANCCCWSCDVNIVSSYCVWADSRADRADRRKLFRHYTVGSYDSFDASRWDLTCWNRAGTGRSPVTFNTMWPNCLIRNVQIQYYPYFTNWIKFFIVIFKLWGHLDVLNHYLSAWICSGPNLQLVMKTSLCSWGKNRKSCNRTRGLKMQSRPLS